VDGDVGAPHQPDPLFASLTRAAALSSCEYEGIWLTTSLAIVWASKTALNKLVVRRKDNLL
jgi:hypothetical protein